MIIDVHGHYTTAPQGLRDYRAWQQQNLHNPTKGSLNVTDDEIRESIVQGLQNAPRGLMDLLDGKNFGKQLVKL